MTFTLRVNEHGSIYIKYANADEWLHWGHMRHLQRELKRHQHARYKVTLQMN